MSLSESHSPLERVDWSPPVARPRQRELSIAEMATHQCAEVAQLFGRAAEFATTTRLRSADEIRSACNQGGLEILVVQLAEANRSRGIVGAVLFTAGKACLSVEGLAVGKVVHGCVVEVQLLALVGAIARLRGLTDVELVFTPSTGHRAVLEFYRSLAEDNAVTTYVFRVSAERLTRLAARRVPVPLAPLAVALHPQQPR